MIKKIRQNYYRVSVEKTVYYIQIYCEEWLINHEIVKINYLRCSNRRNMYSYYRRLNLHRIGSIANEFLRTNKFGVWEWTLKFDTPEQAIGFLYYIEEHYNNFKDTTFRNLNYLLF